MPRRLARLALGILAAGLVQAQNQPAPNPPAPAPVPDVFSRAGGDAALQQLEQTAMALLQKKEYAPAEAVLQQAVQKYPELAGNHYNLACALALQGKTDAAFASLDQAIEKGFRDTNHMKADADLTSLRRDPRFAAALTKAEKLGTQLPPPAVNVVPRPVSGGIAMVEESNTIWDRQLGVFRSFHAFPAKPDDKLEIVKGHDKAGELLRKWQKEKTAAGLNGVLYDNHDRDHSNMDYGSFPQLNRVEYCEAAKKLGVDNGLQTTLFFNVPTLGNASEADVEMPFWRSLPRLALVNPRHVSIMFVQYVTNHLYFYPEHRDHDPGHNGQGGDCGDVFPANIPYVIISQGSSFSDQPFMNAAAATIAAFRPATQQALIRTGSLMPAVQMIFRMSNKMVEKPGDYLTGKAHPTVFDGGQLNPEKMVTLAHAIQPGDIPPVALLRVTAEDQPVVGRDYFDVADRERLFDTPAAIARVFRTTSYWRRLVVSAEGSTDYNQRPLKFHWRLLRGDEKRVKITPKGPTGATAEIEVAWHERRPVSPGSKLESNRVDIGVFAHNGEYYSAPAFISFYFLDNETRVYDEQHRIQSVEYKSPKHGGNYADPLIDLPKDWRDDYHYGAKGELLGWTRTRGEAKEEFTFDGALTVEKDDHGRAKRAQIVRYVVHRDNPGNAKETPVLQQEATDQVMTYDYASAEDRRGRPALAPKP